MTSEGIIKIGKSESSPYYIISYYPKIRLE